MKSSVGVKAAIGVVLVVVIGIGVFLRAGRQPAPLSQEETGQPAVREAAPKPAESTTRMERVQQRLQQLRATHDARTAGNQGAIQVRTGAPGAQVREPRPGPASASRPEPVGAANNPPAAGGPDEAAVEDDPDNIPALTNTALHDADPERRLAAVTLLSASEDAQVLPILTQVLREDADPEVRMAALESLSDFTDDAPAQVVDAAAIGLNDSDPEYRLEALGILADVGDDRARAVMEKALNDPDEEVRSMAEGILDIDQLYEPTPGEPPAAQAPGHVPAVPAPR